VLRGERRFVSVFATVNVPRSSSPFVIPVHQIVPDCLGLLTTLAHRRRLVTLTSLAWTKTAPSATHDLSRKAYEKHCPTSWVKHFDAKRDEEIKLRKLLETKKE